MASAVESEMEAPAGASARDSPQVDPVGVSSLASSWQVAAVTTFCRLFGQALKITPFSAEELQQALLQPAGHQAFLGQLVSALLRPPSEQPLAENEVEDWHDLLRQKVSCSWPSNFENDPLQNTDFNGATPLARAEILYALCQGLVHDSQVVRGVIKSTAEGVVTAPDSAQQHEASESPLDELRCLADRLGNSQDIVGRSMHEFLSGTVLPKLAAAAEQRAEGKVALPDGSNHLQKVGQPSAGGTASTAQSVGNAGGGDEEPCEGQRGRKRSRSEALGSPADEAAAVDDPGQGSAGQAKEEEPDALMTEAQEGAPAEQPALAQPEPGVPATQPAAEVPQGTTAELEPATATEPAAAAEPEPAAAAGEPAALVEPKAEPEPATAAKPAPAAQPEVKQEETVPAQQHDASTQPKLEPKPEPEGGAPAQQAGSAESKHQPEAVAPARLPDQVPPVAAAALEQPAEQQPGDELGGPGSTRPVRSSRMVAPRKFLDSGEADDDDEEEEGDDDAAPPPAKRPMPARQAGPPPGAIFPPPPALAAAAQMGGLPQQLRPQMPGFYQQQWGQQGPQMAPHGLRQQPPGGFMAQRPPPPAPAALQFQVPQFKALFPSVLDVPIPRHRRSVRRRQPRASRASMNRLKQAAHGTLPLGVKKARASVYLLGGGEEEEEASASESEIGEEEEDEDESSSEYSDSDLEDEGPRRGGKRGRGRPPGGSSRSQQQQQPQQQQQQHSGYGQHRGMHPGAAAQANAIALQQQAAALQSQLATAPPQMRTAIMQRIMLLQQQAQQAQQQAQQAQQQAAAAAQQGRGGTAGPGGVPAHVSQLPPEQQRMLFQAFMGQLQPQQQIAVRSLGQDQLMQLLQQYYQSKVLAAAGPPPQQPGAAMQQPAMAPQQQPQQQQFAGAPGGSAVMADQTKLAALISTLTPDMRAQLQALPPDQQRIALMQLLQRQQLAEQQRLMQQQAMAAGAGRGMVPQGMGPSGGMMGGGMVPPGMSQAAMQQPQQAMARGPQHGGNWGGGGGEAADPLQFLNDS